DVELPAQDEATTRSCGETEALARRAAKRTKERAPTVSRPDDLMRVARGVRRSRVAVVARSELRAPAAPDPAPRQGADERRPNIELARPTRHEPRSKPTWNGRGVRRSSQKVSAMAIASRDEDFGRPSSWQSKRVSHVRRR